MEVGRRVGASPADIFAVIANPARHVDIDGSGMVLGATPGPVRLQLGDRFITAMRQGPTRYRSVSTVVEYEPDRLIAWETWGEVAGRKLIGGQRWRYRLVPADGGGTTVTEQYDWSHARFPRLIEWLGYPARMRRAMGQTLDRLHRVL